MARPRAKKKPYTAILVFDESDQDRDMDDPAFGPKIRYSRFATLDEAIAQAEHDLCLPAAVERMRGHMRLPDDVEVPMGLGRTILRIEDPDGNVLWTPPDS